MYLISACLAGLPVRYDGKSYHIQAVQWLQQQGLAVTACPEMLGGLNCPREPAEIYGGSAADVLAGRAKVLTENGADVTQAFIDGAQITLQLAQRHAVRCAVLKENSPSCGRNSIYDGSFSGRRQAGIGITAALLLQHGIEVISEQQLAEYLTQQGLFFETFSS